MLSEQQVQTYQRDGYVIPSFSVSESVVESARERYAHLLAKHPEFKDNCGALLRHDMGFAEFAKDPDILDMVAQIIGEDIALWNMSFFAKPAHDGKAVPWHQDGEYWPIRPLATCTVWVALDDSTEENGCLQVIKGSHREGRLMKHRSNSDPSLVLREELDDEGFDESQAASIELRCGQVSLHDVYLAHGSAPNSSGKSRRGMTMRFMPTTSLYNREVARDMHLNRGRNDLSQHPVLLMRGTDRHGGNEFYSG